MERRRYYVEQSKIQIPHELVTSELQGATTRLRTVRYIYVCMYVLGWDMCSSGITLYYTGSSLYPEGTLGIIWRARICRQLNYWKAIGNRDGLNRYLLF